MDNNHAQRLLKWWLPAITLLGLAGAGVVLTYRGETHMANAAIHINPTQLQQLTSEVASLKSVLCSLLEREQILSADCPNTLDMTDP